MTLSRAILIVVFLLGLSACGPTSKFLTYDGPEVTRVLVFKEERKMYLLNGTKVLEDYDIGLGFAPTGDKKIEGDGRTPEGHYLIDKRNPNSRFHLSIGVSYPNADDIAEAKRLGKPPGGDIFIHGRGPTYRKDAPDDWTWGCIAVTDREVEKIYAMVKNGTPISIYPAEADMTREQAEALQARQQALMAPAVPMPGPVLMQATPAVPAPGAIVEPSPDGTPAPAAAQ
ncbi:L,D-transpeptidase family protein [Palleronia abyssalis]|uniref:L,D-TPase catalytic domain-containing protein n=1 Tax=Palleronia abyssalis TaxID=1501240 RepID=A0A2R8BSM4_9RHOB|nr:L,D-transpeptidase family protein [Palleronia abyssalis]SPJ23143.1 hypothetical protein PAA8504_00948 [Palleronia abyssalis]